MDNKELKEFGISRDTKARWLKGKSGKGKQLLIRLLIILDYKKCVKLLKDRCPTEKENE